MPDQLVNGYHLETATARAGDGYYIVAETLLGSLVESSDFGLPKLINEFATAVLGPSALLTAAPAKPADIKTMVQLISYSRHDLNALS